MSLIKAYLMQDEGYSPFFINDGWQIAVLNYIDDQHISNIHRIEVHRKTDEVFVLMEGTAILIVANRMDGKLGFELSIMKPNITYNIPKGIWHNIAMEIGSKVLIIEKSNTHINDVWYKELDVNEITDLREKTEQLLKQRL